MKILFPENNDERIQQAVDTLNKEKICEAVLGNNDLKTAATELLDGKYDAVIAGATHTTADVLRAGVKIVGTKNGLASSFMLIMHNNKTFAFADCAVNPSPSIEQLSEITMNTADNFYKLTKQVPIIALLSYSTLGSANGEIVEKMRSVKKLVNALRPELNIDGEIQFDAAFDASIGEKKGAEQYSSRES